MHRHYLVPEVRFIRLYIRSSFALIKYSTIDFKKFHNDVLKAISSILCVVIIMIGDSSSMRSFVYGRFFIRFSFSLLCIHVYR